MKQQKMLLLTISGIVVLIIFAGKLFLQKDTNFNIQNFIERGTFVQETASLSPTPIPEKKVEKIVVDFGNGQKLEGEVMAQTVYEALRKLSEEKGFAFTEKQFKYGSMITRIGDKENSQKNAWIYSVNGRPGQIAADRYVVYPGDRIEWKYSKFE